MRRHSTAMQLTLMALMLLGLPLVGIFFTGRDIHPYLELPPVTVYVRHAPFSWGAFLLFAALDLLLITGILCLIRQSRAREPALAAHRGRWPVWGWFGLIVLVGGWTAAWSRWQWFAPWQAHTFCLPWIGYILLVNAWCRQRSGHSLITDAPARFGLLIPVSAFFWWFFEYLNRFVQNWYYAGVGDFSALAYAAYASLAFATVLPAVLSTHRLLLSFDLLARMDNLLPLDIPYPRTTAAATLAAAAVGLALLGVFPDGLFALLWVSPLLIISALQVLGGRPTIFAPLRQGDWRSIASAALAALICGFFWELWNVGSLARWHYAIPYVDRFHIFAMPLLGYGGYLPFGLECLAIGVMVVGRRPLHILSEASSTAE